MTTRAAPRDGQPRDANRAVTGPRLRSSLASPETGCATWHMHVPTYTTWYAAIHCETPRYANSPNPNLTP